MGRTGRELAGRVGIGDPHPRPDVSHLHPPGQYVSRQRSEVHTYTWTLAWDGHALTTRPWEIFDANIFFPYSRTLAFSENLIGSAFLAAPFLWLSGNPVLALNVVSLLSVFLCGMGAYVLGRRIGLRLGAALACGVIFAYSPARFFRFGQTHLTTIQWMPFALAALIGYLDGAGRRHLRPAANFPDETSIGHLASLGVRYVVVHRDWYERAEWADVDGRLCGFESELELVHEESGGRIY